MRFVVISDIHAHNYGGSEHRLSNCLNAVEDAFKHTQKLGLTTILCGGDLFDSGEKLNALTLNKVRLFLDRMYEIYPEINMLAVSGNHDQYGQNTSTLKAESFLLALCDKPNFECVDNQSRNFYDGRQQTTIRFLPYYSDKDSFMQAVNQLPDSDLLLCHNSYPGWTLSPDFTVEDVRNHQMVLCGHIHQYGRVGHVYSIGSPLPRTASDVDKKGFLVVDVVNKTVDRVFTSYPIISNNLLPSRTVDDEPETLIESMSQTPAEILEEFALVKKQGRKVIEAIPSLF